MNAVELERWKSLSLGLAANAFPRFSALRRARLEAEVGEFIDFIATNHEQEDVFDWDGNFRDGRQSVSVRDKLADYLWENRFEYVRGQELVRGRFGDAVAACVRAGFDVAVSASGGVQGFTVGDLRAVFREDFPAWLQCHFVEPISSDANDSDGVWL